MDHFQKQILKTIKTDLIDKIARPDVVSDKLFENKIFTESMSQNVKAMKTDHEKTRHLLDIIPEGGSLAFFVLIRVLMETGNGDAASNLESAISQTYGRQDDEDLPSEWPCDQAMKEYIFVRPCDVNSKLFRDKRHSKGVYSMNNKSRGRCIVISNKTFETSDTRCGTEKDEDALNRLFTQLQFKVVIHKNKTAKKMLNILKEEGKHPDHENADCFVCVICSHGNKKGIFGVDEKMIRHDQVREYFDGAKCPALVTKPKLFFIQACQGGTIDYGVDKLKELKLTDCNTTDAYPYEPNYDKVPTKTDMLIASSAHPGWLTGHKNPSLWTVLKCLEKDATMVEADILRHQMGQTFTQRCKRSLVKHQETLHTLCSRYIEKQKSLSEFLNTIGSNIKLSK